MLHWNGQEYEPGEPCSYVTGGERCGETTNVTLLDGRPLCDPHRDDVLDRRAHRLLREDP